MGYSLNKWKYDTGDYMATMVEQIFSEISHLCRNDDCAHLAAALVAKLVEEKFTRTHSASKKCLGCSNFLSSCTYQLIPDSADCQRNFERYP